jgi:hypothetical protein
MRRARNSFLKWPLHLTLLACAILVLLPPAVAYAGVWFNYAQGTNGVGGTFATTGYAPRDANRTYHAYGYYWELYYCRTDGSCFGDNIDYFNPTWALGGASYAKAFCRNLNDNSGVVWTCQTTHT